VSTRVSSAAQALSWEAEMAKLLMTVYSTVCYLFFLGAFLYAIGFVGSLVVPKAIDTGAAGPITTSVLIDVMLLGAFAVQHSVMARPAFKRWWIKIVPEPLERSTYVLLASLILSLLFWQWRPLPTKIWNLSNSAAGDILWVGFFTGWGIVLLSTFLISHFELFGLSQAFNHLAGKAGPPPTFRTPLFYRWVRHPIYLGFLLAFWSAPVMTGGHLLFAVATTGYILIGLKLEERDLITQFGDRYRRYVAEVGMLAPRPRRSSSAGANSAQAVEKIGG
jgi:protein-S-isoprenylcysteine O-methyltransferase Ste14